MSEPTIGRIVHYQLSSGDVQQIEAQRRITGVGPQGNAVFEGEFYPAMIVRVWSGSTVNLKVFLDGNDTYWATSRMPGTAVGTWSWPERK